MRIDVGGSLLDVEVSGPKNAPAILQYSSGGTNLRIWDFVLPMITTKYRSIRLDMRGSGKSTPANKPSQYSFQQFAKDTNTVPNTLGVENVIFGAWPLVHASD